MWLYKLSKVEERRDFLRERKACWHCGSRYWHTKKNPHKCQWKAGKLNARCTFESNGKRCIRSAAMCFEHKDNASEELIDWLKAHNIKFAVNIIMLSTVNTPSQEAFNTDEYYAEIGSKMNKGNKICMKTKISSLLSERLFKLVNLPCR